MSITPRILNKDKDKFTTFHIRIMNGSNEDIVGRIKYKITMPNGKIEIKEINREEKIKAHSEANLYDKYYLKEDSPLGRYYVDGIFLWNGQNILSQTNENDFFDVK